ncbi:hypothetical protein Ancab_000186 [Ancistrocladus abbreviatus]
MGNSLANLPCCKPASNTAVKLIFWEGTTRTLTTRKLAGEIMFEFPDCVVLHADSLFIGHRIPALAVEDRLIMGQTYFVFPIDRLPCNYMLSAASLSALMSPNHVSNSNSSSSSSSSPSRRNCARPINFGDQGPFEYINRPNGGTLIKVVPEFIMKIIMNNAEEDSTGSSGSTTGKISPLICSTPELKKQYDQLVRPKEQVWSPKLETISEHKIRFSPCKLIGLEWKQRERDSPLKFFCTCCSF